MRVLKTVWKERKEVEKVFCNVCGSEIKRDKHGHYKDFVQVEKKWGYNSLKDGKYHCLDMCEQCYDAFIKNLKIAVEERDPEE